MVNHAVRNDCDSVNVCVLNGWTAPVTIECLLIVLNMQTEYVHAQLCL